MTNRKVAMLVLLIIVILGKVVFGLMNDSGSTRNPEEAISDVDGNGGTIGQDLECTDAQKRFIEDLRARFSKHSTEKLQKMKRKGRDSWSEEALMAVDSILKERGIE